MRNESGLFSLEVTSGVFRDIKSGDRTAIYVPFDWAVEKGCLISLELHPSADKRFKTRYIYVEVEGCPEKLLPPRWAKPCNCSLVSVRVIKNIGDIVLH